MPIGENCELATGAAETGTSVRWWSGSNCNGSVVGTTADLGTTPLLTCFNDESVDDPDPNGGGPFGSLELLGY